MADQVIKTNERTEPFSLPVIFIFFRLILFASLPFESIAGYGDFWNFYAQAGMGVPYLDHWTEFPPLFPLLSRLVYQLVVGRESAYIYLMAGLLTMVQAGSLGLALRIARVLFPAVEAKQRIWGYFILLAGLFYGWTYFDSLAVLFLLLTIYALLAGQDWAAVLSIALGGLTKWFPLLIIPAIWKIRHWKKALVITLVCLSIVGLVWGALYAFSPEFTWASLIAQGNKGSWETIWALIDGNLRTGNFSSGVDRLAAGTALTGSGNPAVISPWFTLAIFGGLGLYLLVSAQPEGPRWMVSFIGLTMVIFFIWSPGYSPQWLLYLLPLIILALDWREGALFGTVLVLLHLLEWPLLLSRGQFSALWYLVPLRTALMMFLGLRLYQTSTNSIKAGEGI